jgi:hypothetical protein
MADISEAFRAKYLFLIIFWPKLINSFSLLNEVKEQLGSFSRGFQPRAEDWGSYLSLAPKCGVTDVVLC